MADHNRLPARRSLDLSETFIDRSFASAPRWLHVGKTKRGKRTKIITLETAGLPVATAIASASPHETRVETTLSASLLADNQHGVIANARLRH